MSPHPVTNFEIQKYYQNDGRLSWQNEPKFNDVSSRNNLNKTKDEEYVINLDEYESWFLYANGNSNAIYFDSFRVE